MYFSVWQIILLAFFIFFVIIFGFFVIKKIYPTILVKLFYSFVISGISVFCFSLFLIFNFSYNMTILNVNFEKDITIDKTILYFEYKYSNEKYYVTVYDVNHNLIREKIEVSEEEYNKRTPYVETSRYTLTLVTPDEFLGEITLGPIIIRDEYRFNPNLLKEKYSYHKYSILNESAFTKEEIYELEQKIINEK